LIYAYLLFAIHVPRVVRRSGGIASEVLREAKKMQGLHGEKPGFLIAEKLESSGRSEPSPSFKIEYHYEAYDNAYGQNSWIAPGCFQLRHIPEVHPINAGDKSERNEYR
jgi:hypothetical protein